MLLSDINSEQSVLFWGTAVTKNVAIIIFKPKIPACIDATPDNPKLNLLKIAYNYS